MDLTVTTYIFYLAVSVALSIWVARTLSRTGHVFLLAVARGDEQLAIAVNRLLVVGFYLLDLGFVTLFMRISGSVQTARASFEALSIKLGTVLLVLGLIHLLSVLILNGVRRRATRPGGAPGLILVHSADRAAVQPADSPDPSSSEVEDVRRPDGRGQDGGVGQQDLALVGAQPHVGQVHVGDLAGEHAAQRPGPQGDQLPDRDRPDH